MNTIIPSIIAKNQKELDRIYNKVKFSKVIQLDVMDGSFVKNKSLWFELDLPKHNYELHLMINNPETFIDENIDFGNTFIVHYESTNYLENIIRLIHSSKKKIYLAIKPKTPVSKIKSYLSKIDGVLVMTVEPGRYGAKFIPSMLNKIREIRKLKPKLDIEVDGSMNLETIRLAKKAGANRFSVGSYLQNSKNMKKTYSELQKA